MSRGTWPTLRPETPEWQAFTQALAQLDRPTPCAGSPLPTTEHAEDRAAAAHLCRACPLLELCHEAAESVDEAWGVWGGVDREPAPRPKRERKTA